MITNKAAKRGSSKAGFSAMHIVMGIGLVAVVLLAFFGLPSGVKDFFAKFGGNSGGLAAISSFGDFGTKDSEELQSLNIEEVAKTIYTDIVNLQEATKTEKEEAIKNGICFKNPANEKDFYNIVSGVKGDTPCADGETIKTVVTLPGNTVFADPASGANKYVVFNHDGTITASKDVSIRISNSTGARMITVTPLGVITYTDKIPAANGSAGTSGAGSLTVSIPSGASAEELARIAAGLASVLNSIQNLQNQQNTIVVTNNQAVAPAQPVLSATLSGGNYPVLNWTVPYQGSSQILAYKIFRNGSFLVETTSTNYIDFGASSNVSYCYAVSARNYQLEGAQSNSQCITTNWNNNNNSGLNSQVPNSPSLSGNAQNGQVVLNWTIPSAGSSSIIEYKVYRSFSSGTSFDFITSTSGTSVTLTGLTNNRNHYFKVRARNSYGESAESNEILLIPVGSNQSSSSASEECYQTPCTPLNLRADTSAGKIFLTWSAPAQGGAPIQEYKIYRSAGKGNTFLASTSATNYTDTSVEAGTEYTYYVTARNFFGESVWAIEYAKAR